MRRDNLVMAAGLVALGAVSTAGLTIWLLLTSPMTVASAVLDQQGATMIRSVIGAVFDLLLQLLRYL